LLGDLSSAVLCLRRLTFRSLVFPSRSDEVQPSVCLRFPVSPSSLFELTALLSVDLTPELWIVKLLMGGISSEYDSKDVSIGFSAW
jgi:hypothetical protein